MPDPYSDTFEYRHCAAVFDYHSPPGKETNLFGKGRRCRVLEDQQTTWTDRKPIAETPQKLIKIGVAWCAAKDYIPKTPASAHPPKKGDGFDREDLVMAAPDAAFFQISLYACAHTR